MWDAGDTHLTGGTTGPGGVYSFSGLAEGDYIVRVDLPNFAAPARSPASRSRSATTPEPIDPDNNIDNDDNGSRAPGDAAYSRRSRSPTTASRRNRAGPGQDGDADADTNNTLDLGFFANPPPVIADLGGDSASFTEDGAPVLLDDASRSRNCRRASPTATVRISTAAA